MSTSPHTITPTPSSKIDTHTDSSTTAPVADSSATDDTFTLYDLRVEAVCPPGRPIFCGAKEGDYFTLEGEMLYLPPGQGISIYSLASILPLLAAKQRPSAPKDWMSTDAEIACPDPHCPSRWRIVRTKVRTFNRAAVTAVPMPSN